MISPQEAAVFWSWLGEPVKQAVKNVFDDVNSSTEALDIFHRYRNANFSSIQVRWGQVKILGMPTPRPLAELYEPLSVSTNIRRRFFDPAWIPIAQSGAHPQQDLSHPSSTRKKATRFVEENRCAVLLAGPGCGKTTFLRFLALAQTEQGLFEKSGLSKSLFPFFVPLRVWSEATTGDVSIEQHCKLALADQTDVYAANFVERVLSKGLAIVLLDGLDEVPGEKKRRVIDRIQYAAAKYPETQFVVSCRTADYEAVLDGFAEAELQKLSNTAVGRLVQVWFSDQPRIAEKLRNQLTTNEDIASLVRTPLYLSLVCIQFRHDLRLPHRRTEVYRRCVEVLLRDWDAMRNFRRESAYERLDDERKLHLFEFLAGKYLSDTPKYLFTKAEAEGHVGEYCELIGLRKSDGPGVLREIESHHGIVEQYSIDSFMFSHPSLQEYFSARFLIGSRREGQTVRKVLGKEGWLSIVEFVLALHPEPAPLFEYIQSRSNMKEVKNYPSIGRRTQLLRLIYRALCAGAAVPKDLRDQLLGHLVDAQVEMGRVFRNGGVLPVAVRYKWGIRHAYLFSRLRRTLQDALQPLQRFANEIVMSPLDGYPARAISRAGEIIAKLQGEEDIENAAIAMCLLTPIAQTDLPESLALLRELKRRVKHRFFVEVIDESLGAVR